VGSLRNRQIFIKIWYNRKVNWCFYANFQMCTALNFEIITVGNDYIDDRLGGFCCAKSGLTRNKPDQLSKIRFVIMIGGVGL